MVSFGYIVIATVLIAGTAIFSLLLLPINDIFNTYNGFVSSGMVTQQNLDAMNFQRNLLIIVPLIILIGCAAWGIVRAIERKWEGLQ